MSYLKRVSAPKSWDLLRKDKTYVVSPRPGAHKKELSFPLILLLRQLGYVATTREAKLLLADNDVLIDGVRVKDYRRGIGLMDVVSIPKTKKFVRVVLDVKGRLRVVDVPESEASVKVSRVQSKRVVKSGKIQLNLSDGRNLLLDKSSEKVGDVVVLSLPDQVVKKVLHFEKGASAFLTGGNHVGMTGTIEKFEGDRVWLSIDGVSVEAPKRYVFIVGKTNAEITVK